MVRIGGAWNIALLQGSPYSLGEGAAPTVVNRAHAPGQARPVPENTTGHDTGDPSHLPVLAQKQEEPLMVNECNVTA